MHHPLTAFLALALAALASAAQAQDAPRTVSDYEDAMRASALRLDTQVSERQKLGDMAAAQRLVLASAMINRAAEEFRGGEQASMTDPVSGLPAPVPQRAAAALAQAAKAQTHAADDPAFIEETQTVFNSLLDALPVANPHPVLYGLLSRDLADTPLTSDVVIYGYRLIDKFYRSPPVVLFDKSELPSVVAAQDRIDVSLPDEVKKAINFAPPPCDSRASFGLRVRNRYAQQKGVWPFVWRNQVFTNADVYALPTPILYSAKVVVSAQGSSAAVINVPFDRKSPLATADCDETRSVQVAVPLPPGARVVACKGDWVDSSGTTNTAKDCDAEKGTLYAKGQLVGGARVCSPDKLCTCPAAAQGFLEATGSYEIDEAKREVNIAAEATPLTFPAGGAASSAVTIPEGQKLRHVALSFSRRACPTEVDTLDLNIGDDPEGRASGVSKTGSFRAEVAGNALKVGAADAFAADPGKKP